MKIQILAPLLALLSVWGISYSPAHGLSWSPYESIRSTTVRVISRSATSTPQKAVVKTTPTKLAPKPTPAPQPAPLPQPQSTTTSQQPTSTSPQPAPQPAPTPPATTPNTFASEIEGHIFALINKERANNGLGALSLDTKLADVARAHSYDMLKNNYFSHDDQNGCSSSCRLKNIGYTYWATGENIYMMSGYNLPAQNTAQLIVNGWMNSSGHRANILNSSYTNHGVGIAVEGKNIYATQVFSKPR